MIGLMNNADIAEGEEADRDGTGQAVGDPFHSQSGHGARTGEGTYGRSIEESLFSTEARRIGFRRVSRAWHVFCMFDSALREGQVGAGPTASMLAGLRRQATEEEDRRWRALRQVDVGAQLRRMLGPAAQFRGV